MDIHNKVVVISGGASGMGFACAKHLKALGARIAIIDHNESLVNEVAEKLTVLGCVCDVTDDKQLASTVDSIVQELGAIHGLINCAGVAPAKRVVSKEGEPMPLTDFARVIDINLVGSFNLLRLCAAVMAKQDALTEHGERGVIINTASVAAYEGQIGQAAYSASKGGVIAMALPIARELERFGIRVMTIAPGIMRTPMIAGMPDKVQASLAETVTFPKRLGQADEYAHLAAHIITNEYLNAEVIRLDGAIRLAAR